MQFLIQLNRESVSNQFPLNYQYQLSNALECIFEQVDFSKISSFLGDDNAGIKYIPFTFSQLQLDHMEVEVSTGSLYHLGQKCTLDLRLLVNEDAVAYLKKLIMNQRFNFSFGESLVEYSIEAIEIVPPPVFKGIMTYSAVTPVFLADNSAKGTEFISPADSRYPDLFKSNLLKRFVGLIPELKNIKNLNQYCPEIEFLPISQVEEEDVVFNMYQMELIHLKGFKYDFKLKASPVLQEFGYYAGFGAQNSLGFGCVNIKNIN